MYETYKQNEREFEEKFVEMGLLNDMHNRPLLYDTKTEDIDLLKSHNRLATISLLRKLAEELEGERKMIGTDLQDISPTGVAFNSGLQLSIDKINTFISQLEQMK